MAASDRPQAPASEGGPPAGRPRLPPELATALVLFVVLRLALSALAFAIVTTSDVPGPCHFERALNDWETVPRLADEGLAFRLVGVWQRWDACWYMKVATFGYEPDEDSANFWPLTPLLIRVVSPFVGGEVALAGLIVATIAYVLAIAGLLRLVGRDLGGPVARRTALLVSVAPGALFLLAPYTEAPFLALAVWAILAARERRWTLAIGAGFLAGITRIHGIFLVLPVAWELVRSIRAAGPIHLDRAAARTFLPGALAVLAPLAGFAAFIGWTATTLGRTPLDTQRLWGGTDLHPPWEVVAASLRWAIERNDPLQALNLVTLLGAIALVVGGIRRLPLAYSLFALPQVALISVRLQPTPLTSTTRLVEVVFPLFVVAALATGDRRVRVAWVLGSGALLAALARRYVLGDFVA